MKHVAAILGTFEIEKKKKEL